jgi:hypothetical protein
MKQKNAILVVVITLLCIFSQAQAGPIYFLVAEPNGIIHDDPGHGDSYVLPLTDPCDIAHARDLIINGKSAGQPIVVASITCSPDCINPWSWHVTEFLGFADMTPEILDGWPGFVDYNCTAWCNNTQSRIGFWRYTVVSELGYYPRHLSGDLDDDNDVDFNDFDWLGSEWSMAGCIEPNWCGGADIDKNSVVNFRDLKWLSYNWLITYEPQTALWFDCWTMPYQCYGDVDGLAGGSSKTGFYHVTPEDLSILMQLWDPSKGWPRYPSATYNPCADFNRDFVINDNDVDIADTYLQVLDSDLPGTCPACP